jgi:hypothetical protein
MGGGGGGERRVGSVRGGLGAEDASNMYGTLNCQSVSRVRYSTAPARTTMRALSPAAGRGREAEGRPGPARDFELIVVSRVQSASIMDLYPSIIGPRESIILGGTVNHPVGSPNDEAIV